MRIGVFDSGIGGLTVLRALKRAWPGHSTVYLGDTARVPYGTKSGATVVRYAQQNARYLLGEGIELLVVACNTASAYAIEALREELPIPVVVVFTAKNVFRAAAFLTIPYAHTAAAAAATAVITNRTSFIRALFLAFVAAVERTAVRLNLNAALFANIS